MKSKVTLIFAFVTITIFLCSICSAKKLKLSGGPIEVGAAERRFSVYSTEDRFLMHNMTVGRTLTLKLRANITDGYIWYLENADNIDKTVFLPLNLDSDNAGTNQEETETNAAGDTITQGYSIFRFRAIKRSDNVFLRFGYKTYPDDVAEKNTYLYVKII